MDYVKLGLLFLGQGNGLLDSILNIRIASKIRRIIIVSKVHGKFSITFLRREGYGRHLSLFVIYRSVFFIGIVICRIDTIRVNTIILS